MTKYNMIECVGAVQTGNDDKYYMVANTGSPMRVQSYSSRVIIDMAGVQFAGEKLPVIGYHDAWYQLGVTTRQKVLMAGESEIVKETTVNGPAIVADWRFTNTQEFTAGIKENLDNGFPYQVSVGAQPIEIEKVGNDGTAIVNGREVTGPVLIIRASLIKELSVVVFGADRHTSTVKAQERGFIMSDIVNSVPENPIEGTAQPTQNPHVPESTPTQNPGLCAREIEEQTRILGIGTIAKTVAAQGVVGEIELEGGVIFRSIDAAEKYAKANDVSVDAFQKAMIEASRRRPVGPVAPGIHARDAEISSEVLECAILKSVAREAHIPLTATTTQDGTEKYGLEAWYDEKTLNAADAPSLRNPSLGMVYATLIKQVFGYSEYPSVKSDYFWEKANKAYVQAQFGGMIHAAGPSPFSLDSVWLNVARKILLATSQSVPTTYQQWAKVINVQDFKPTTLITVDLDGTLSPVGNDGVLEHGRMADSQFTVQTETFGKIYGITRKERLNDDMNLYLSRFITIGLTVPKTVEQLAYYTLLKGLTEFFTAKKGNLVTGADSAFSQDALQKVIALYDNKVGFDKQPIVATPDRVLVGTSLKLLAERLYKKENPILAYNTGASNEVRYNMMDNEVQGMLRPITSAYINNTSIKQTIYKSEKETFPGQSATQYFVSPDPNSPEGAAFYVPCLHGNINPHVESFEFQPGMLGTGVQVYADFNVVPGKTELMTRVTGAAN